MGDYRKLDRRLLWAALLGGLLVILYLRLVPFDVDLSGGAAAIPARFTYRPLSLKDVPFNLLIFLPFSFGLAGLLYQSGRTWRRATITTVLCVVAISAAIELVQVYIPERVPSVADVLTNGVSALLGVWAYRLAAYGVHRAIVGYATPANVALGLAVYGLGVALLAAWLVGSVDLGNWDARMPLSLGNENTDFRPWEGTITAVSLLGRPVTQEEATALLAGNAPDDAPAGAIADAPAHYNLTGAAPFADQAGTLPPLDWLPENQPPPPPNPAGATVGAARWLATGQAVTPFNEQARAAAGFTVAARFTAALAGQRGPARIVSVSADSGHRNITLGQQGDALSIRLRTPSSGENGERPEMLVPGFFSVPGPRQVVLSYDRPNLVLYTGNAGAVQAVSLAPGLALFQDFASTNRWLLPFPAIPHLYDYRFWALFILPVLLLAAVLLAIRDSALAAGPPPDR